MRHSGLSNPESLIEQIYASALHPALWPETLRAVAAYTGSRDMTFQGFRATASRVDTLFSLAGHLDAGVWANHLEVIAAVGDIRGEFGVRSMRVGRIYHDRDYISEADMRRHPYFQELLRPIGLKYVALLAGVMEQRRSHRFGAGFGLQRTSRQGPLLGLALRRFGILRPHLIRAVRIFNRHGANYIQDPTDSRPSSARFDLDERTRVLWMNEEAQLCVQQGLVRIGSDRTLAFSNAESTRTVQRAAKAAMSRDGLAPGSGCISIGRKQWSFHLAPVPIRARVSEGGSEQVSGVALKLTLEPPKNKTRLMDLLTPSEGQIVSTIAYGVSLRDAAATVGVTYETARNHLKRAMFKLDVHSQAALVSRVLLDAHNHETLSNPVSKLFDGL